MFGAGFAESKQFRGSRKSASLFASGRIPHEAVVVSLF